MRPPDPASGSDRSASPLGPGCSVAIFTPSPALTVTVEGELAGPEVHLHAGGQGFWVARMAARLGASVTLCAPLGGESGTVLASLLAVEHIALLPVQVAEANGVYVHDRRGGERRVIVETPSPALHRHELDELYGVTLTAGLDADATLLTGPRNEGVLPPRVYERLAADLGRNDRIVLADLAGEPLAAALRGGLSLVKVSHEELVSEGRALMNEEPSLAAAARQLREEGAASVLVSRGSEPSLALLGDRLLQVAGPRLTPLDRRGAGDSMFAALGVALAAGLEPEEALRYGAAAGALNVTRHGLGTGGAEEIARLAGAVRIRPLGSSGAAGEERPLAERMASS